MEKIYCKIGTWNPFLQAKSNTLFSGTTKVIFDSNSLGFSNNLNKSLIISLSFLKKNFS